MWELHLKYFRLPLIILISTIFYILVPVLVLVTITTFLLNFCGDKERGRVCLSVRVPDECLFPALPRNDLE